MSQNQFESENRPQCVGAPTPSRADGRFRAPVLGIIWATAILAVSGSAYAQSLERDPDLPPLPPKLDRRLRVTEKSLHLGSDAVFSDTVSASEFRIPLGDGTFSSWSAKGWAMGGTTGLDYNVCWGLNTACGYPIDPTRNRLDLSLESNYFSAPDAAHYMEAYIQFQAPDGAASRPFHIGIPYTGPRAYKSFMLINTNWFSILDETQTVQKLKVSDWLALARDFPFYFSTANGCAGCLPDVGLQPADRGQLEVIKWSGSLPLRGDLLAAGVNATSLAGDGSAITNLNASAIAGGSLADATLSLNVALANRSTTFLSSQYFLGAATLGAPGVVVAGSGANIFPNLAISNAGAPVDHQWKIVNRGDTGAFVITDGMPGDDGRLAIDMQGTVTANGNVAIQGKLKVAEGLDKAVGQAVLNNGMVTVATKAIRTNSRIFLSYAGITGQLGILYSNEIQDETSFEIHSTSATDNSPVNYWIIN